MQRKINKKVSLLQTSDFRLQRAFTVVELLVVMAMIGILSLVIIPSYKNAKDQLALERSAVQLAQYISRAREMAMSFYECGAPCAGTIPWGYGIYLKKVPADPPQKTYILFADTFGEDGRYKPSQDVAIEEITLENNVIIRDLTKNHMHIGFKPPDPMVSLSGKNTDNFEDPGDLPSSYSSINITIALQDNPAKQKTIRVNAVGLITID